MESPSISDVRIVFATSMLDGEVQTFMDDAVLLALQCPALVASNAATQRSVVRWLTAHFMSILSSGILTQKAIGDASDSYAAPTLGAGLKSTSYGMRALALVPELADVGKPAPQLWVL